MPEIELDGRQRGNVARTSSAVGPASPRQSVIGGAAGGYEQRRHTVDRGTAMRRFIVVITIAALAGAVVASPAEAAPANGLNRRVSGPFSGTTAFEFGTNGCSFVHQVFDLTYQTARGKGSLHLEGCAIPDGSVTGGFRYDLDFVMKPPRRGRLIGSAAGGVFPMDLTLTVERGTKRFRHATGTIDLDGVWTASIGTFEGTANGTLTGHLQKVPPKK
jgi:hypothetical protein